MEEFIKPIEPSSSSEELLSKEDRQALRNERLLEACSLNDTEVAIRLIDDGADCCYEDDKQWTPLQWAATNGNLELVRKLLAEGAADMYLSPIHGPAVAEELHKKAPRGNLPDHRIYPRESAIRVYKPKRYTPLHWAAFKGHLRIVWLLIKAGLSPHVKDILGNTVLHQAAAGGDVATVKTILSLGVDVKEKNGRGRTAVALASTEGSKMILEAAAEATQCPATGEFFSYKVMPHMCGFTEGFFAPKAVKMFWMFDSADDEEKEKPVTWCQEAVRLNQEAEARISRALCSGSLEEINTALLTTADHSVCPKLRRRILQHKSKMEGEIALRQAMDFPDPLGEDDFFEAINRLSAELQAATDKECDEKVLTAARIKLKKVETGLKITRLVRKPSYDNFVPSFSFVDALGDAIQAGEECGANTALLTRAVETRQRAINYLKLQSRIEAVESVCAIPALFDMKGDAKAQLPDWAKEFQSFQQVVLQFREEIAAARESRVSSTLISIAESKTLNKLEALLIEMKRLEEEQKMKKTTKKKSGSKAKAKKK